MAQTKPDSERADREQRADLEGLFGPDSVTWRVHSDPAMVLGGLRALLLQALHPIAMNGFAASSTFWSEPWARLQRTGDWVATVTFGTRTEAEAAGARLRALHARLPGGVDEATGRAYRIDDPDLLTWVHCTEVDSFLSTYRRSGGRLAPGDGDRYVEEMRESARMVGLDTSHNGAVPSTEAELAAYLQDVRPELRLTAEAAKGTVRFFVPPMPLRVRLTTPARPAWAGLVTIAFGLLPGWARRMYRMPGLPTTAATSVAAARTVRLGFLAVPDRYGRNPRYAEALDRLGSQSGPAS